MIPSSKIAAVDGFSGFLRENATVGIAWDDSDGKVLVSIDGSTFSNIPFPEPVTPNVAAGAALFPVISGRGGCRVRHNLGGKHCKFQHNPPSSEYISCAEAQQGQV
jgi:hypothetical protein